MKKLFISIITLIIFIPFIANAETCETDKLLIESIEIESKSNDAFEISEATANDKTINLNMNMNEVGDSVKYKLIIGNNSDQEYDLDNAIIKSSSECIEYSIETKSSSNVIEANSSQIVYLKVKYKNEIPEDFFEENIYNEIDTVNITLSNEQVITVPNTLKNSDSNTYLFLIIVFLIINTFLCILITKKKFQKFIILLISTMLIMPLGTYAICKCNITIESNIRINKSSH